MSTLSLPREPQERMEPLVSEETKEILVSWVPGASRWEGDFFFSPLRKA
jgi:hypothetical protein